jgi:hypothetical protein
MGYDVYYCKVFLNKLQTIEGLPSCTQRKNNRKFLDIFLNKGSLSQLQIIMGLSNQMILVQTVAKAWVEPLTTRVQQGVLLKVITGDYYPVKVYHSWLLTMMSKDHYLKEHSGFSGLNFSNLEVSVTETYFDRQWTCGNLYHFNILCKDPKVKNQKSWCLF